MSQSDDRNPFAVKLLKKIKIDLIMLQMATDSTRGPIFLSCKTFDFRLN